MSIISVRLFYLCLCVCSVKGGALVSVLYDYSQHGDPAIRSLLLRILSQVSMCGYGCGLSEKVHFIYDPLALGRAKQMDCWMKCSVSMVCVSMVCMCVSMECMCKYDIMCVSMYVCVLVWYICVLA